MAIAGCSQSIKDLLSSQLAAQAVLGDYRVEVLAPRQVTSDIENQIGLVLYRVESDPSRRHVPLPRTTPLAPGRIAMALELRFLLVVWGKQDALGEHLTLGYCMDILDRNAIIAGSLLSPAYDWESDDALKITLEPLATDELMRIWDAMNANYQLSVGYVVRTVRLAPRTTTDAPMTNARSLVFAGGVPE